MRNFNPDKELNKIRKGRKNKVMLSICTLLLIIAVGSTYALYQVRHTNKLVFNTVEEFKKRDIYLSVLVNGETKNEFPGKEDGYAFSGYECDGDANVTFNPDKWMASVNANGPDKCTIKFGPKNINYDTIRKNEDVIADETNDANLRFVGANPSNYIWFNCLKYDDLTKDNAEDEEHKCERWRIIGILNNMTIVDEKSEEETTNQSLVKIIRSDVLGIYPFDTKNIATGADHDGGSNNWATATLMTLFNPNYDDNSFLGEPANNSLYWNAQNGKCLLSGKLNDCDFSRNGLKNDLTKNMIENVTWNLGVLADSTSFTKEFYNEERGTRTYKDRAVTWNGKIALMYPSDYIFSTSGGTTGRELCLNSVNKFWNKDENQTTCAENSWLYYSYSNGSGELGKGRNPGLQQILSPSGGSSYSVEKINVEGPIILNVASLRTYTRPSLYLKSTTQITSGQGSYEEPYIIN